MAELLQKSGDAIELSSAEKRALVHGYSPPVPARANGSFRKRKVSTFNFLLSLLLFAFVSVLYISNIIAVNRLALEIEELKTAFHKTENVNEILRSEIHRMSSMERITTIAAKQMGMVFPTQPPIWFEVEEAQVHKPQEQ